MALGISYSFGKSEIVNFLQEDVLYCDDKILDVGAGFGMYGKMLGFLYEIDAVEVWQESVEYLKTLLEYRHVYASDIRDFKYPHDYDLVIFGDVLEHLSVEDAQKVLKEAEKHSKHIMVAIPYLYEQGEIEGNKAEIHLQPDLTPEIFNERYPDFKVIWSNKEYGYYFK